MFRWQQAYRKPLPQAPSIKPELIQQERKNSQEPEAQYLLSLPSSGQSSVNNVSPCQWSVRGGPGNLRHKLEDSAPCNQRYFNERKQWVPLKKLDFPLTRFEYSRFVYGIVGFLKKWTENLSDLNPCKLFGCGYKSDYCKRDWNKINYQNEQLIQVPTLIFFAAQIRRAPDRNALLHSILTFLILRCTSIVVGILY